MTESALCDQFSKHQENISKATLLGSWTCIGFYFERRTGFHCPPRVSPKTSLSSITTVQQCTGGSDANCSLILYFYRSCGSVLTKKKKPWVASQIFFHISGSSRIIMYLKTWDQGIALHLLHTENMNSGHNNDIRLICCLWDLLEL